MELELPPEARALLDAIVAIGSDLDLRGVLSRIVEASCRLTDAEYGVLGIVDDNGEFTDLVPNGAVAGQFDKIGKMPEGHGLLGLVPRERRAIRVDHVADHPVSTGAFPRSHPTIDSFLGAPVLVGEQAFGHLYLGNKRGGAQFSSTDQALVEALARAAGVIIDNARAFEQVEWRRRWVASTAEIGSDVSGTVRVQEALDELVVSLRDLCGASLVAYVRRDDEQLEIRQVAGNGDAAPALVELLASEIRDVDTSRVPERLPAGPGRATLIVPVVTRLAGSGVIIVDRAEETPSLRGIMLELVAVTAVQVGLILDREQALRDRSQLLVAKDRDRIARDLHDLVIQRLFATGMQLQGARSLDVTGMRERVDGAVADLDVAIKELRAAIFELGTGSGRPLLDEVRDLLGEYAPLLGFRPMLRITGPVDRALVPEAGTHVLMTLREALSNVVRHARASSVSVELTASSAWFRIRVSDDGVGFDKAAVLEGQGTGNLSARAADLGGHVSVESEPGHGTTLEWVIPAVG
jgi:signal transduction histidine kinase